MGSNASTTRKSTAGTRASTAGYRKSVRKENELEEEFSDLILHEVSKNRVEDEQQGVVSSPQGLQGVSSADVSLGSVLVPVLDDSDSRLAQPFPIDPADDAEKASSSNLETATASQQVRPSFPKYNFLSELIEDEFNELNDGLIETENPELTRNIIPHDDEAEFDRDIDDEDVKESLQTSKRDLDMRSRGQSSSQGRNVGDKHLKSKSLMIEELDVKRKKVAASTPVHHTMLSDAMDIDKKNSFQRLGGGGFTQPAVNPDLRRQNSTPTSSTQPSTTQDNSNTTSNNQGSIPVEIKWVNVLKENIQKISIIGLFSGWRDVIRLQELGQHPGEFVTTVFLPLGVHKLLYIINNEYRVLDMLPTATDQEGIFFNWFEVLDEAHLFNHSQNQPIHVGASTEYDANIISLGNNPMVQSAGKYDVDRINRKNTSFLTQISKLEEQPEFEHVEFGDSEMPTSTVDKPSALQLQNIPAANTPHTLPQMSGPLTPPIQPNYASSVHGLTSNIGTPKYILYQDGSFLSQHEIEKPVYSSDIPEMFLKYDYFKNKSPDYQLPEPPQLPAQLNNVLLNKMSLNQNNNHANNIPRTNSKHGLQGGSGFRPPQANFQLEFGGGLTSSTSSNNNNNNSHGNHGKRPTLKRAESSYYASNQEAYHLSIPNHVILNHLMTTSIRNEVLTVACITRYSGKFVTQIMHSPADT